MSAFIRISHLSKVFALAEHGGGPVSLMGALRSGKREVVQREVRALDDVSFEIREGERVGIIGRNGAGKTTLLSILAGISDPTSGTIEAEGDIHAILTIGTVLREDATGRENIYIDGLFHGKSRAEIDDSVQEIIDFTELGEFIDRPVRTYSSGMKAKLAFALGSAIKPDILIIDETLSVGDAFFADKASRRMREIADRGRIVILVSHGLSSIVEMCDRCLWLDQGRLIMDGSPAEVTRAYQASVQQADEAEFKRKFEAGDPVVRRPDLGRLEHLGLIQRAEEIKATALAFEPLTFHLKGLVTGMSRSLDAHLRIVRVDGRTLWDDRLSSHGLVLPACGSFDIEVAFDPFILGANLFRIDAQLLDEAGPIDQISRAFEVIDEHGQHGGTPLLFYPPLIKTCSLKDV
ncbi:ABC transporter ATP-binding protein [Microvirga alba]|uniref:ABC transporter ATP-binding protein n=1 Tax=Microvirga alba TaxID=2791025 RepID=A0A931BM12_9HYPH|nr:ABC transporter ATP-binding protein [Microvirga alba]MBF9231984.1 ABC transporter ATP-binding protein [Microvirga alba]